MAHGTPMAGHINESVPSRSEPFRKLCANCILAFIWSITWKGWFPSETCAPENRILNTLNERTVIRLRLHCRMNYYYYYLFMSAFAQCIGRVLPLNPSHILRSAAADDDDDDWMLTSDEPCKMIFQLIYSLQRWIDLSFGFCFNLRCSIDAVTGCFGPLTSIKHFLLIEFAYLSDQCWGLWTVRSCENGMTTVLWFN